MQCNAVFTLRSSSHACLKNGAAARLAPPRVSTITTFPRNLRSTRCCGLGDSGDKGPKAALRRLAAEAERTAHTLIDCMTPRQEYDTADVALILLSTLVFMWVAAAMYKVYAFAYYAAAQQAYVSWAG